MSAEQVFVLTDGAVTPIRGSPLPDLQGQMLDSDSGNEYSPVLKREQAKSKAEKMKKRKGKIEVSFNIGKRVIFVFSHNFIV